MAPSPASSQSTEAPSLRPRRACRNCAQVKERCVPRPGPDGTACERCHRLHKDCTTPASVARGRASRPQRHGQQHQMANSPPPQPPTQFTSSDIPMTLPLPTPPSTVQTPAPSENYAAPGYWAACADLDVDEAPPSATLAGIDATKQATLVAEYRASMAAYFPFVAIDTAAAEPKRQPFTHAAVLVAALHRHPALQKQAGNELLQHLGSGMVARSRKSLDLAQGLLLLVAWYPYYSHRNPQLMNLQHLAQALLVDLGLTKPHSAPTLPFAVATRIPELLHGAGVAAIRDSLPDRRALLAAYYTAAQLAVNLRRLDHPHWSEHMEHCCAALEAASSFEAARPDAVAAHLLRLHVAAEPYLVANGIKPRSPGATESASGRRGAPAALPVREYVRCFREDLDSVISAAPAWLIELPVVRMHVVALDIALYDAVASAVVSAPYGQTALPVPAADAAEYVEALDVLLERLRSMLDLVCGLPPEEPPVLSVLAWSMVGQAADVLARINFLRLEGWDLADVRARLSVTYFVETLSDYILGVFLCERRRFPLLDASRFGTFTLKLRQLRKWYDDRITKETAEGSGEMKEDQRAGNTPGANKSRDAWAMEIEDGFFMGDALWSFGSDDFQWM